MNYFVTSAIGGISDEHIAEFAFVKPKKVYTGVLMKIAAAAACVAVIATGVPRLKEVIYNSSSSDILSSVTNTSLEPFYTRLSHVCFDGKVYLFRGFVDELPKESKVIGNIESTDDNDIGKNGYSDFCNVGDPIYQNPETENEIYVYSDIYHGGGNFVYYRLTVRTTEDIEAEKLWTETSFDCLAMN